MEQRTAPARTNFDRFQQINGKYLIVNAEIEIESVYSCLDRGLFVSMRNAPLLWFSSRRRRHLKTLPRKFLVEIHEMYNYVSLVTINYYTLYFWHYKIGYTKAVTSKQNGGRLRKCLPQSVAGLNLSMNGYRSPGISNTANKVLILYFLKQQGIVGCARCAYPHEVFVRWVHGMEGHVISRCHFILAEPLTQWPSIACHISAGHKGRPREQQRHLFH